MHEKTVLFVCEFNSARSQLAEALAKRCAPPGVRILSAGLTRTVVNEYVLQSLAEIGMDTRDQYSKSLEEISHESVDVVFVLAEPALSAVQNAFPKAQIHLVPLPDPILGSDCPEKIGLAVRQSRDAIHQGVRKWLLIDEEEDS